MAARTFEQDFNALSHGLGDRFAAVRATIGQGLEAMGPLGRRLALTTFGAVLALGLGAAAATALRLPSELTDPAQPQDQVLAQTELPSEAAARANALENPPVYTVAADHAGGDTPTIEPSTQVLSTSDDASTPSPAVYTTDDDDRTPSAKAAAPTPSHDTDDAGA